LLSSGRVDNPQSWNRYGYVLNNPLILIDPDGLYECKGDNKQCEDFRNTLAGAIDKLTSIKKRYGINSNEYKKTFRALAVYGCESKGGNCVDSNGNPEKDSEGNLIKDNSNITVSFGDVDMMGATVSVENKTINITFGNSFDGSDFFQGLVGNEGSNAADAQEFLKTGKSLTMYKTEYDSLFVDAVISEFVSKDDGKPINFEMNQQNGGIKYLL